MSERTDTPESLDAELQQQQRTNAKLLALLEKIQAVLPDSAERIGPMINEVVRTKRVLDDCQGMIAVKRAARDAG